MKIFRHLETAAADVLTMQRPAATRDWRTSKWLAMAELLIAALMFTASFYHRLPLGRGPWLLVLGWVSLCVRRIGWRGVGLAKYRNWAATFGIGLCCGALLESFELFVSQPILVRLLRKQPDLSEFHALTGNLKLTALYIVLVWILAAFGEEMIYRGYLMNRVADLLNRTRTAWVVSLIVVHVVFGLAHIYQGWTGVLDEGLMGVLLAVIYLLTRRNLAVPIVAHGVQDSIDMILMFFGRYPGM
jgi:membrane protease YdiL (CAAX protease family)